MARSIDEYSFYKGWWAENGNRLGPMDWALVRAVVNGESTKGQVIDIEKFDGTRGTILNSGAPLKDSKSKVLGGVAVFQDITSQRELEHNAVEAKERAELYVDLLTHDINNMVAGVSGYLQLVMELGRSEVKEKGYVQKSLDILKSISHLIDNCQEDTAGRVER